MKVSVVIPAFNEEKYIGKCLTGMFEQEVPAAKVGRVVPDEPQRTTAHPEDSPYPPLRHPCGAGRGSGPPAARG